MNAHILVVNCGSSSLKFALLEPTTGERVMSGLAESLGSPSANLKIEFGSESEQSALPSSDHRGALAAVLAFLQAKGWDSRVRAVGHRVVHGGELFVQPTLLDDEILETLTSLSHLAPLHNPVNIEGIQAAREAFPLLPQVAVFDTAFHQTMPAHAARYAVPQSWYKEHGVRRYGFHGSSHHYVATMAAKTLNRPLKDLDLITAHLGNGCSATAVHAGESVDTSMGMTPLSGLVMGTRSGDVDPGVLSYMAARLEGGIRAVDKALNKSSGLLGLSGSSHDMRTLLAKEKEGCENAHLAIEVFCYRLAATLASLSVALPKLDALVFTGGIGERSAVIRERVVRRLWTFDLVLDGDANLQHGRTNEGRIGASSNGSTQVLVLPTDEESMIAQQTMKTLAVM